LRRRSITVCPLTRTPDIRERKLTWRQFHRRSLTATQLVHTHINLDGREVAKNTMKHTSKEGNKPAAGGRMPDNWMYGCKRASRIFSRAPAAFRHDNLPESRTGRLLVSSNSISAAGRTGERRRYDQLEIGHGARRAFDPFYTTKPGGLGWVCRSAVQSPKRTAVGRSFDSSCLLLQTLPNWPPKRTGPKHRPNSDPPSIN
jgi:hypothetical protein